MIRASIDRSRVVAGGLALLRHEGHEALSARALARRLGCSTQPIYSSFGTLKELERALLTAVRRDFREFLSRDHGGQSPFENIGLGFLRFSRQEPKLFNWLLCSGRLKVDFESGVHSREIRHSLDLMAKDPSLAGLASDQVARLLRNLWIYIHGLAVLQSNGILRATEAEARTYMNEMAESAIRQERLLRGSP